MSFTQLPGVHDRHVHLGLISPQQLSGTPVTRVTDLGWDPQLLTALRADPPVGVRIDAAGRFHSAPYGYPSGRSWAPDEAFRAVQGGADAEAAVAEAVAVGSCAIKITLHQDFPLLPLNTLRAFTAAAARAGLPAVAHVEGPGLAAYALEGGVNEFVHTPWTERLDDGLLHDLVAARVQWISTLAIHTGEALENALDNGRRFLECGGTVRYGTDLGNGDLALGLNRIELRRCEQLGLHGGALRAAVCDDHESATLFQSMRPLPNSADELYDWYANSELVAPAARS